MTVELGDLLAQRGLGDVDGRCRPREALAVDDFAKVAQLAKSHGQLRRWMRCASIVARVRTLLRTFQKVLARAQESRIQQGDFICILQMQQMSRILHLVQLAPDDPTL
jgi:hypothetical protein